MSYELSEKEEVVYQMHLLPERYFLYKEHRQHMAAAISANGLQLIKLRINNMEFG